MPDPMTRLNAALEGRYRIERELGQGGMATVYLAEDLKHHRKVALKVLKPELAAIVGAERFLAEIRTTASLQHPHILPLYDSGDADGLLFYVMPHVEGESLRDRLDREHQLPVDEAVRIATNVAEALDYAHRRGVIHRDIKPANVLMQDGKPVISDFGIALAVTQGGAGRLTETGLSLGTPHYMSPEQATGDTAMGAGTDIYALACVLYEMLIGEPPYTGSTPQAILGKIIMAKPVSATEARKTVPPNVDGAIRKALEKVPADRFESASAFAKALGDPGFRHGTELAAGVTGTAVGGPWNRLTIGFAATTALLALTLVWGASTLLRPEPRAVARFDVTPAEYQSLVTAPNGTSFALSPDGSRIVYMGVALGLRQLLQRKLEDLEAVAIPGTGGASAPVLSPDGMSVAFRTGGAISTVSLAGGPPVTVVASGVFTGNLAWGSDGMIYFTRDDIIYRVAATGGEPETVTTPTGVPHRSPVALPDGRGILLTVGGGFAPPLNQIAVVGPEGGEPREILTGVMARYAASGHIVYATADGTLMAAPFDVRSLEVTGPSVALVEGVRTGVGFADFALSQSGTLLYGTGGRGVAELVWVSRAGQAEPVDPTWTGVFSAPALSPEGARLAVAIEGDASTDIWVKQLDRGPSLRLTFEGATNDYPTWTPDGRSVTFSSDQGGSAPAIWTKRADGSSPAVLQLDEERVLFEPQWSPDGAWLVARTAGAQAGAGDIVALRPALDSAAVPLVATGFVEYHPTLSPDGRWMAYQSNETGNWEIYVVPFPNASAAKWAVSTGGGREPLWSRTGREIFYRNPEGDMVAVPVETAPTFTAGSARVLFPATEYLANVGSIRNYRQYDVTPDGQRFIMLRPVGGEVQTELILVQNFLEELKARVPK